MITLWGHTAKELIRSNDLLYRRESLCRLEDAPIDAKKLELASQYWRGLTSPLEVALPAAAFRRRGTQENQHIWGYPMQPGSLCVLNEGFNVASPEMSYFLYAKQNSFVDAVLYGMELCGTYSEGPDGLAKRRKLCTNQSLTAFVRGMYGVKGAVAAAAPLPYILENSWSPMESRIALILSLPMRRGGYGLPVPQLNAHMASGKREKGLLSYDDYHGDLTWENAKLIVEYDGSDHRNDDAYFRDAARRNDFELAGYTVVVITKREAQSYSEMELLAKRIAYLLHHRLRISESHRASAMELRRRLFSVYGWR